MPHELEETGDLTRTAHITVASEEFESRVEDALREVADDVDISGFREGNVPFSMIKQRYGSQVRPKVIENLIRENIQEVAREFEERLLHVGETQVENVPDDGGDLEFAVDLELRPDLDPVGYLGLPVEKPEPELSADEIDARLEEMREQFATLEPIEIRDEIREGDIVTFDLEPTSDDEALQALTGEGIETEVGSGQVFPAIEEGLDGAELQSTVEVEFDAGEEFPFQELRGRQITLQIDIKTAKQKVLPELDDEFAKDTGEVETLLELRSQIREELEEQKEHRAEHLAQDNLVDTLIEQNDFDLPPNFLDQQVEQQLDRQAEMFEQQGLDPEQIGAHSDKFVEETRQNVARNMKEEFLLLAIAEKEGLEVEQEDMDAFFEHQAQHEDQFSADQLRQVMRQNEDQWENVKYQAQLEKTKEFLLDEAEIETVAWPDQEHPGAAAEASDEESNEPAESTDESESDT